MQTSGSSWSWNVSMSGSAALGPGGSGTVYSSTSVLYESKRSAEARSGWKLVTEVGPTGGTEIDNTLRVQVP